MNVLCSHYYQLDVKKLVANLRIYYGQPDLLIEFHGEESGMLYHNR